MSKIARALMLSAAMATLVAAGGVGVAPARQKEKDKAKDVKAGTVEVYKDKAGDFRFRVKDTDGKTIAMPTKGYDTKEDCLKALDLIKTTLNTAKVMEVKDDGKAPEKPADKKTDK